ncbi:MAG: dienelactone hydrolase family protein [Phycisphaerae bacterium]|nr:dienelactone hydrolase family protein [Phycisphaerae bacterium]
MPPNGAYNPGDMMSCNRNRTAWPGVVYLLAVAAAIGNMGLSGCLPISGNITPSDGPYAVGIDSVRVPRQGFGRFEALVYYPAISDGRSAAIEPSGAPYPGVAFGHGWLATPRMYHSTLITLAAQGYVVIAPASETQLFPSHPRFAQDMRQCLTWLEQENARPESRFYGLIDAAHFGIAGHSMGGGAGMLAAAADDRVKAIATQAPAETWPDSAIAAVADIHVPIIFIAGSEDTFTPLARHAQPMYDNANLPKELIVLDGGYHCGFIDIEVRVFCDAGSMDHQIQLDLTWQHTIEFFDTYLKSGS